MSVGPVGPEEEPEKPRVLYRRYIRIKILNVQIVLLK